MSTPEIELRPTENHAVTSVLERRLRPLMGTFCAIEARGSVEAIHRGITAAYAAMTHIEQCMHPTRPSSDIARLNSATHERIKIDATTWAVLSVAHRLHHLSNGVFDPCLPSHAGCLLDLELLADNTAICHAPIAIDLGGIAKGYAIDQGIAALHRAGCSSGLVNAGGDLRVYGAESQQILIRTAQHKTINITLRDTALAVSEVTGPNHPVEHQGYYFRNTNHAPAHQQVAVLAEQAIIADALTKCVMFCSDAVIEAMLSSLNATRLFLGNTAAGNNNEMN
jgi:FAD:protein FMN transferase